MKKRVTVLVGFETEKAVEAPDDIEVVLPKSENRWVCFGCGGAACMLSIHGTSGDNTQPKWCPFSAGSPTPLEASWEPVPRCRCDNCGAEQ